MKSWLHETETKPTYPFFFLNLFIYSSTQWFIFTPYSRTSCSYQSLPEHFGQPKEQNSQTNKGSYPRITEKGKKFSLFPAINVFLYSSVVILDETSEICSQILMTK